MTSHTARTLTAAISFAAVIAFGAMMFASSTWAAVDGPTVVLTSTTATSTATASTTIPITATFSEEVTGFASTSVSVSNGATANVSPSGTSTTFTFDVTATANGSLGVMIPADAALSASSTLGNQQSNTLTFTIDTTPPVISNVAVSNIGTSSATVTWDTDDAATSQVFYGTTTSYGSSTTLDAGLTTSHSVALTNLAEATLHHFQVQSTNVGGTATSSDMTFTTSSTAATTPLAINSITSVKAEGIADNLFADGWQWTIRFTVPDNEDAFRIRFSDWGNATTSFAAASNIRLSIAQSQNASTQSTGIITTGNGYSDWFYLVSDVNATTPGRQVDLSVEVKIPFGTANGSYSSNFTAQTFPSTATSTATSTP